jgi:hypothetical protein
MPRRTFGEFLWASFDALAAEEPDAFRRMSEQLAPRSVRFEVDGDSFVVRFRRDGPLRVDTEREPAIEVATSRCAILRLIDAEHTLASSVLEGELGLRGRVGDLLAFHDGLMAYLHGAVRTHRFPDLLREYRGVEAPSAARDAAREMERTAQGGAR